MKSSARPPLRYIPFRKKDIIEMCLADGGLAGAEESKFRSFCHLLQSVFHFECHEIQETLKDLYAPINPDRDTRKVVEFPAEHHSFTEALHDLLNKANYERLSQEEILAAFNESSLFSLKLEIDFDEFEEVFVYIRGESEHHEEVSTLMGLVKKTVTFQNFDRVVVYIRFRDSDEVDPSMGKPGTTLLKLFQNIPRADVEMLFPNTRLAMRPVDKLMIGVPALIGAVAIATTKAGASLLLLASLIGFYIGVHSQAVELDEARLLAILAALGGLASYIWKQFSNFRNRKLLFMQTLTQNLYFKSLDNNAGVFHRLVDDAEEEECKEAMIAYYFLLVHGPVKSAHDLDLLIEQWLRERWDVTVDFEVEDALNKLDDLKLIRLSEHGIAAVTVDAACEALDRRWDEYFSYAN